MGICLGLLLRMLQPSFDKPNPKSKKKTSRKKKAGSNNKKTGS
jgi:hypothetical protein